MPQVAQVSVKGKTREAGIEERSIRSQTQAERRARSKDVDVRDRKSIKGLVGIKAKRKLDECSKRYKWKERFMCLQIYR